MMERYSWRGFEYPTGCILSPDEKAELIKDANKMRSTPLIRCKKSRSLDCPRGVQLKCFTQTFHREGKMDK